MSFKKILNSFKYSFTGLKIHSQEHNFQVMCLCGLLAIGLAIFLKITYYEWLILVLIIGLVLSLEAFNTTLERTLDYLEPHFSKKVGIIKDLMSGVVAIAIFTSVIIGCFIFLPKIISLLKL
ncbi:MAG: diacylglycerol kinase family protein [Minisyncoccia bacterium]